MTTFSLVICTVGRPVALRRALTAVGACDPPPDEVLVIDGDEARSAEPVATEFPGVRYVRHERGLTRQRNRGLAEARSDVVVFLDDDACPAADILVHLDRAYRDASVVGATGRILEPGDHPIGGRGSGVRRLLLGGGRPGTFTAGGYPRRLPPVAGEFDVEFMQGAFMSARRSVALEVGFDESLAGYGLGEDEDFSRRLSQRGRVRYLGDVVVHHDNSGFATRDRRAFSRHVVLHRAYFFRKNFPQTRRAKALFRYQLLLLLAHRLANRDFAGFRGLLDGLAELRRRDRAPRGEVTFVSSHGGDGGSERYLERLLAELGPGWIRSVVVLGHGPHVLRLREAGLPVTVLPVGKRFGLVVGAVRLRRHLHAARPDVVHANGVKAALVAVLAGTRPVWVKHDTSRDGWLARVIGLRCREVVGVSRSVTEVFETVPRVVTMVVPTGIRVRAGDHEAARRTVLDLTGHGPVLTLVGRFDPVKGHLDLLAAAPPQAAVLFVGGEDPSHADYAQAVRATARARVVEGRDDSIALITGSDAVVLPSTTEGFGLVAVEAMAVGTPVVAYAAGALPEVIGDAGVLVPPGDIGALREAIEEVLADEVLRHRLVEAGRQRVATVFDPDRWARAMAACYAAAAPQ